MMRTAKISALAGLAALFAVAAAADSAINPIVEGLSERALQLKGRLIAQIDARDRLATTCETLHGTALQGADGSDIALTTEFSPTDETRCFFSFGAGHSETLAPDDIDDTGRIHGWPAQSYIRNQYARHVALRGFCSEFNQHVVPFLRAQDIGDSVSAVMVGAQCVISVNDSKPLVVTPDYLTDSGVIESSTYDWVSTQVLQSLPLASKIKLLPQPPVTAEPPPPSGP